MNISKKAVIGISGTLLGLSLVAGQAQAVQLDGSIGLTGVHVPLDAASVATTLDLAVALDIGGAADAVTIDALVGDFAAFDAIGGAATHSDFTFNPFPGGGIVPLWTTAGGTSFDLSTLDIAFQTPGIDALTLTGTGVFHAAGFDDTPGTWTFTANGTNPGNFTFSSSNEATPVPEPSILALLGLGLLGFVGSRRLNKTV